jgi:hypothetical protein
MSKNCQPEKFILDATSGYRSMWMNKNHPNAVYIDQRPECEPQYVRDFRKMPDFQDESFQLIIFDPPHIIRANDKLNMNMVRCFGQLSPETWRSDIKDGFKELWRLLKPMGVLLFKWSNQQIPSNEILKLLPVEPIIYQISQNKPNRYEKGKRVREVQTLWFCFMKIPKEKKP